GIGGQAGGYRVDEGFGAAPSGVSTGRHIKSTGKKDFVLLTSSTPNAANSAPIIGPVAITEIMYHPKENVLWLPVQTGNAIKDEFIEIQNTSGAPVDISGWKFTDGVSFTFPAGQTLAAGERAVIVPIAAETFRTKYSLPA